MDNFAAVLNDKQAQVIALTIGVLAQADMMGREKGNAVAYQHMVAQLVGDLAAVFGLEFVRECQSMMQQAAMKDAPGRIHIATNGHSDN